MTAVNISELLGKTVTKVEGGIGSDELILHTSDGKYTFYHQQDCCESVTVNDITGDLSDLIGSPITLAEESSNSEDPLEPYVDESYTWTFYKLATIKGYVDIRWLGTSNGYSSEDVTLEFTAT